MEEKQTKKVKEEEDLTVSTLLLKKKGQLLLLGKNLDKQVKEYILKLREHGCAVNTTVVIAATRGMGKIIDHACLNEGGGGGPSYLNPFTATLLKLHN